MRYVEAYPGEALHRDEYHLMIEATISQCGRGGNFRFDAPAKCPECCSVDFAKSDVAFVY